MKEKVMKQLLSLVTLVLLSLFANAQKLTLSDVKALMKDTEAGAEIVIEKGFDAHVGKIAPSFKDFRFQDGPNESISFEVSEKGEFVEHKYIRSCYSKKYHQDFVKIKQVVTSKGKKVDFYLSEEYRTYYSVYYYDGLYFHFGKGVCESTDRLYKYDSFFCVAAKTKF